MAWHLKAITDSPSIAMRGGAKPHAAWGYQVAPIETRLREALAREEALIRQIAELTRQQDVLTEFLGSESDAVKRVTHLTRRQRQIMTLILAGQPNKNIAVDIGISQRTVENHRAAVMSKTSSKSLPALAWLALALVWHRIRENESVIDFIVPAGRIDASQDNRNARARHHDMRTA